MISNDDHQNLAQFWDIGEVRSVVVPQMGTINDIRILDTDSGKYVARFYRHRNRERIEREHRVVAWVSGRGVPAVVPLRTSTSETYARIDNRFVTLLPFIEGVQVPRESLSTDEIVAMGQFLGNLHNV